MDLCEYGKLFANGLEVKLICSIDKKNCCLIRWCQIDQCIKMSENYYQYGCKLKC